MSDPVHHPDHYQRGGLECKDVMAAMLTTDELLGYWYGCSIKYLFRWQCKSSTYLGQKQDLEKAKQCIDFMIEALEAKHLKRQAASDAVLAHGQ